MGEYVPITAQRPTRGPTGTKNVINPIVDDLNALSDDADALHQTDDDLWNEIKKLQNAPPGSGGGGSEGVLDDIIVALNGTAYLTNILTDGRLEVAP